MCRRSVQALVLFGVLGACSPKTQNVRALSTAIIDTGDSLEPVLALGYPSCIKAVEYHMLKMATDAGPEEQELLAEDYKRRRDRCDQTKQVQRDVLLAASTLTALAAALTDLAGDQPVQHAPKEPPAAGEPSEVAAATDETVATITAWVTAGYRKKQLAKAIEESAEPVAKVLSELGRVTTEVYIEEHLKKERDNLTDLFQQYDRISASDPVSRGLLKLEYQRLLVEVNSRLARAERLRSRLDHLSAAHAELVHAHGALSQEKLLAEVKVALADTYELSPAPADPAALPIPGARATDPEPSASPDTDPNPIP